MKIRLVITIFACIAILSIQGKTINSQMLFHDDFETYTTGIFPSAIWEPHYNVVSDPSNNIVTDINSYSGQKSLQLYGAHSGCWAAETGYPMSFPDTVIIECALKASGDIFTSSSCHDWDIALGLGYGFKPGGSDWFRLVKFNKYGNITGIIGDVIKPYQAGEWYKIKAKVYFIEKKVDYWINGDYINTQTHPTLLPASSFTHLHFSSGGGKGWIDDITVELSIQPSLICCAFLTPDKLNVMRSAEHSFKVYMYPCEPMDISVGDTADVYIDLDNNGNYDSYENYLAIVSSTDSNGVATDIAVKVYDVPLVDEIDPFVAIYSINDFPIVDSLGNPIDYLQLNTFSPHKITTEPALPEQYALEQNYPNPFNPETRISYSLTLDTKVELVIYNVLGQRIRTLVEEVQTSGYKSIVWNGKDDNGEKVSSGIYFYKLKTEDFSESKKMVLLR